MPRKKKEWNDGLKSKPGVGGRVRGRDYTYLWKYQGVLHHMNLAWVRMKAQCKFRKEDFYLTFEDYQKLWEGNWDKRGRRPEDLCLSRKDWDGEWSLDNCHLIPRLEHFREVRRRQCLAVK